MSAIEVALTIPADHPAYAGHFPGQPILPGVVLIDAAIAALAADDGVGAPCQIKSAKFLSPVVPGEALTLRAEPVATGGYRFEIVSGARAVASGAVEFGTAP